MTSAELMNLDSSGSVKKPDCELFEQCYGKEAFTAVKMFIQLDQIDQTKITTRMEVMLEEEKYAVKKESNHA